MIDVESVHTNIVLQGETWITVNTDYATYVVLIEWIKFPEKNRYEDAKITRVHEITENEDHWYENEEQRNIENWDEIERVVWDAFDNH